MKRIAAWLAVFGALIAAAPVVAETLPYKDGRIPEEEQGTEQLIPVQAFRNTVYFEGFWLYYTKNRFNIVTRYKPPVCPGGELNTAFYTTTSTKYGYVTTPEHIVPPSEQVQEYTYSTLGYFGPLSEAKVKLHVRSNCTLTPTAPAPQMEVNTDLPLLRELPPLPPRPQAVPEIQFESTPPAPSLSQEEIFKKLVPAPTPVPEKLDLVPAASEPVPGRTSPPPLAPLSADHPLLR